MSGRREVATRKPALETTDTTRYSKDTNSRGRIAGALSSHWATMDRPVKGDLLHLTITLIVLGLVTVGEALPKEGPGTTASRTARNKTAASLIGRRDSSAPSADHQIRTGCTSGPGRSGADDPLRAGATAKTTAGPVIGPRDFHKFVRIPGGYRGPGRVFLHGESWDEAGNGPAGPSSRPATLHRAGHGWICAVRGRSHCDRSGSRYPLGRIGDSRQRPAQVLPASDASTEVGPASRPMTIGCIPGCRLKRHAGTHFPVVSGRWSQPTTKEPEAKPRHTARHRIQVLPAEARARNTTMNSSCRAERQKLQVRCVPSRVDARGGFHPGTGWTGAARSTETNLRSTICGGPSSIGVNGSEPKREVQTGDRRRAGRLFGSWTLSPSPRSEMQSDKRMIFMRTEIGPIGGDR